MKNLILVSMALLVSLVACDGKNTITGPSGSYENPPLENNPPNPQPEALPSIGTPYPRSPIGGDPSNSNPPVLIVGKVQRTNLTNIKYDFDLWEEAAPGKPHMMASNIPENGDETSFQLPSGLRHSTRYVWKVSARGTAPDGSIVTSRDSNFQVFVTPKGICNNSGKHFSQGIPREFEVRALVNNLMMNGNETKQFAKACAPVPPSEFANDLMVTVVNELQRDDPCWGYMKKDPRNDRIRTPYKAIPRDILAYAWGGESEGSPNMFVIDFVNSGCENDPSHPNYMGNAESAKFVWSLLNRDTGTSTNGVWTSIPDRF